MLAFRFRKTGRTWSPKRRHLKRRIALRTRLWRGKLRLTGPDGTGPWRTRRELLRFAPGRIRDAGAGVRHVVESSRGRRLEILTCTRLSRGRRIGLALVALARTQLGVVYVWADANPYGPEGGPGAGFDCSGLILWLYQHNGITFPHLADAQMRSPLVETFSDPKMLRPGDLVFYRTDPDRPTYAAHVELYSGNGMSVGASSGMGRVVERPYDTNPVLCFGYVPELVGRR